MARAMMNDLRVAFGLLTILPVRYGESISARAFAYYPLVGLAIGLALTAASLLLRIALPGLVAAALVVVLWVMLTGALHLDGFSDACDGLFAATTRERRLEILRDVHLGAFGATGLALLLITKVAAVASASTLAPVLLAPVLGRWALVYAAAYPPARNEGMAVVFRAGLTRRIVFVATVTAAVICVVLGAYGVVAFVAALAMTTLIARIALNRLGGLTGDIYGMICESVEVAVLVLGTAVV
ncbi:MAG: adenosylcobinamide-GDP ribazoletransferase [Chloroflexi bacterium]|nr:adenosylcobinamide-GDP ribazoletransferase [Chloroflexota bacterium]